MRSKIVSLDKFKTEKQYRDFHSSTCLNLALDTVYQPAKRDIKKEMIQGYIRLLSK